MSEETAKKYAEKVGAKIIFTSAATGEMVEDAFTDLISHIVEGFEKIQ